jgi:hypothetical protein
MLIATDSLVATQRALDVVASNIHHQAQIVVSTTISNRSSGAQQPPPRNKHK